MKLIFKRLLLISTLPLLLVFVYALASSNFLGMRDIFFGPESSPDVQLGTATLRKMPGCMTTGMMSDHRSIEFNIHNQYSPNTQQFYCMMLSGNPAAQLESNYPLSSSGGKFYSLLGLYYMNRKKYEKLRTNHLNERDVIITLAGCGVGPSSRQIISSIESGQYDLTIEKIQMVAAWKFYYGFLKTNYPTFSQMTYSFHEFLI